MLWWHWIVLGIIFIVAEMIVPNFIIIWLGISAIIVGMIDYLLSPSLSTQLYIWSGLSTILLIAWFYYFKRTWRSPIGQAEGEYIHIPGRVTEKLDSIRYKAEFELPILGDRRWVVESNEELNIGDKIEVSKVYGQIIKVKKRSR